MGRSPADSDPECLDVDGEARKINLSICLDGPLWTWIHVHVLFLIVDVFFDCAVREDVCLGMLK